MKSEHILAILAHNEERRIISCLDSVFKAQKATPFPIDVHLVVNGSTDQTAILARSHLLIENLSVHELDIPDKCNAWNHFIHSICPDDANIVFFMDGDAETNEIAFTALAHALEKSSSANAASALPLNGRSVRKAREALMSEHGLCGDLYALQGSFVSRMKAAGIRLPVGKVGDDSLVGALAAIDLGKLSNWDRDRIIPCPDAGFLCEPISLYNPSHLRLQFKRMIRYSVRGFEIQMMQALLRKDGAIGLPDTVQELHLRFINRCSIRWRGYWTVFDWLALRRIHRGLEGKKT